MSIPLAGGFESTYQPAHDRDVMETTAHDRRWRDDLALFSATGARTLRYPVRWHRVEPRPGEFDWSHTDEVLGHLRDRGLRVIVDLVHHTSYPAWLEGGFADPGYRDAYLRYVEAFCRRYPWTTDYTLMNEPFATWFLCGHEAIWPPYRSGLEGFVEVLRNALPPLCEASAVARRLLPDARHVWVDACEHHHGFDDWGRAHARTANDRRFFVLDAFLGRLDGHTAGDLAGDLGGDGDGDRPFVREVVAAGGADLLRLGGGHVDVVGLDYYAHCQWDFGGGTGRVPTRTPTPLRDQIGEFAHRYDLPVMVTETNLRGTASDRVSWFRYVLEQCEGAVADGVDVQGLCWFPFIDSADWGSLLFRCEGEIDPVGVVSLGERLERVPTTMTDAWTAVAAGARAADLPAYAFQLPAADWLSGYLPHMAHWDWEPPPAEDLDHEAAYYEMELRVRD